MRKWQIPFLKIFAFPCPNFLNFLILILWGLVLFDLSYATDFPSWEQESVYYYVSIQAKPSWDPNRLVWYGWKLQPNGKVLFPKDKNQNPIQKHPSQIRRILVSAYGGGKSSHSIKWKDKDFLKNWENSFLELIQMYPYLESIQLDWEGYPREAALDFSNFVCYTSRFLKSIPSYIQLHLAAFPPNHPDNPGFHDWKLLTKCADTIFVMLYDYHNPRTKPGPVTSKDWILENLARIQEETQEFSIKKDKLILGLPLYGYEWKKDGTFLRHVSLREWEKSQPNRKNENHEIPVESKRTILYPPPSRDWLESWIQYAKKEGYGGVAFWQWGF